MEHEETHRAPYRNSGGENTNSATSATKAETVEEHHQPGIENESNPEIIVEEYYHYNNSGYSNNSGVPTQVTNPHHDGYNTSGYSSHAVPTQVTNPHHDGYNNSGYSSHGAPTQVTNPHHDGSDYSSDGRGAGNNISASSTGHTSSSYYDPSGILYEINHAYVVPSLEPIPENQVLSTISEEVYQEPSSSSYDSESGNSQDEVFYTDVKGGSGYSATPYSVDVESCPTHQGNQRDEDGEAREPLWEPDLQSESDRPNLNIQTCTTPGELLSSPEEQFQPINLKNRLANETSTVDYNEVETPSVPVYTTIHEPSFTSTKTNLFPDHQFDGRATKEINHFSALDHHSGYFRRPSISDSIRDPNRKLSRNNHSFNVTEKEFFLQDAPKDVDVTEKSSSSTTKQGHPDIDGGWAWVVMGCCFSSFLILLGLLFTCNLYYAEMLKEFGHSRSYTAWVGSLVNSFFMLGSIASSSFIQKFSCRTAMILGSVIMTSGYIASAFATSLEMIFVTYGIVVD